MALTDFFRINLPYGIARNENGDWMAFNREYLPIGFNTKNGNSFDINKGSELPVYTKYKSMREDFLLKLSYDGENGVKRDEKGEIISVWLYNDRTNPQSNDTIEYWDKYFEKIRALAKKDRKISR